MYSAFHLVGQVIIFLPLEVSLRCENFLADLTTHCQLYKGTFIINVFLLVSVLFCFMCNVKLYHGKKVRNGWHRLNFEAL